MLSPKDVASKSFVRAYDKYTFVLCSTAVVAYCAQQYFVRDTFDFRENFPNRAYGS